MSIVPNTYAANKQNPKNEIKWIQNNDRLNALADTIDHLTSTNVEQAYYYLSEMKAELNKKGNPEGWSAYYHLLGICDEQIGLYDEALDNYLKAKDIIQKNNNPNYFRLILTMSNYYLAVNEYSKAIELCYKGIDHGVETEDYDLASRFYNNLSLAYLYLGEVEKAIQYNDSTISLKTENAGPTSWGIAYTNKGFFLSQLENTYDEQMSAFLKAEEYFIAADRQAYLCQVYINITSLNVDLKNYEEAKKYANKAKIAAEKSGDKSRLASVYNNMGYAFLRSGDYNKGVETILKGLEISDEIRNFRNAIISLEMLQEHYLQDMKDTISAYKYTQKMMAYKDSLINETKVKTSKNLNIKYESEKKEKLIAENELKIKNKEIEIANQNKIIAYILLTFIVFLILGLLFYQRYKNRQKLKLQEAILEEKEKGFRSVLMAQEEERQRIAGELHDSVGQQLSVIKMAFQSFVKKTNLSDHSEDVDKITQSLDTSADEVRAISHQMMPRSLKENGLVDAIHDLLSNLEYSTGISFEYEHYDKAIRLPEEIEITLFRITQELINNVVKHANASEINAMLHKSSKSITLLIEDNGKGFEKPNDPGIGLFNIKNRIEMLKGRMNIGSEGEQGTFVNVVIPLND